jgi:sugar (pentulose or hexulose) kinase
MVHCNNGTGDLDAWVGLFAEFGRATGMTLSTAEVYETLYTKALEGDPDGGGLLAYNYLSGEPITSLDQGRPVLARTANSRFSLPNLMRTHLFSCLATLRLGMDLLLTREKVALDTMFAHGGLFKTRGVGQQILAAAIKTPVSVGEIAGEGGAWGMALLADYMRRGRPEESLGDYLAATVFHNAAVETAAPTVDDMKGFDAFMARYERGLHLERTAVTALPEA